LPTNYGVTNSNIYVLVLQIALRSQLLLGYRSFHSIYRLFIFLPQTPTLVTERYDYSTMQCYECFTPAFTTVASKYGLTKEHFTGFLSTICMCMSTTLPISSRFVHFGLKEEYSSASAGTPCTDILNVITVTNSSLSSGGQQRNNNRILPRRRSLNGSITYATGPPCNTTLSALQ
jgi:hypothetical protein